MHAYLIEGDISRKDALAAKVAKEYKVSLKGNPDFHTRSFSSFGIDDARELKNLASLRATQDGVKKLFIIAASAMTGDAQNALLKLFEEPTENTIFFLLVPHGILLPTLRSRLADYPLPAQGGVSMEDEARDFLKGTYGERGKVIAELLKEKDREIIRRFMDALEKEIYEGAFPGREESLQDIAHLRRYLSDRSPSLKMILEHLAASLPQK